MLLLQPNSADGARDEPAKNRLGRELYEAFAKGPDAVVAALRAFFRYYHETYPTEVGSRFQYAFHGPLLKHLSDLMPVK